MTQLRPFESLETLVLFVNLLLCVYSELCLLGSLRLWSDPGLRQLRRSHFPPHIYWGSAVGRQEDQQRTHCEFETQFWVWIYSSISLCLDTLSSVYYRELCLCCSFRIFLFLLTHLSFSCRLAATQWVGLRLSFQAAWLISRQDRNRTTSSASSPEAATTWSNSGSKLLFNRLSVAFQVFCVVFSDFRWRKYGAENHYMVCKAESIRGELHRCYASKSLYRF